MLNLGYLARFLIAMFVFFCVFYRSILSWHDVVVHAPPAEIAGKGMMLPPEQVDALNRYDVDIFQLATRTPITQDKLHCSTKGDPKNKVDVMVFPKRAIVMKIFLIVVAPLDCVNIAGEHVPCCGGGNYVRIEVKKRITSENRTEPSIYMSGNDNGDGSYTFAGVPIEPGYYDVTMEWANRLRQHPFFKKVIVHKASVGTLTVVPTNSYQQIVPEKMRECTAGDVDSGQTGVWVGERDYVIASSWCKLRRSWADNDIRQCFDRKFLLVNGDSTTTEVLGRLQAKLFGNFEWHELAMDPTARAYDIIYTNRKLLDGDENTTRSSGGSNSDVKRFTTRMAHVWNGSPHPQQDKIGLPTYQGNGYIKELMKHTNECFLSPRVRMRGPWEKLVNILDYPNRTESQCSNITTANFIMFASGMHDLSWVGIEPVNVPKFRHALKNVLQMWKGKVPKGSKFLVRTAPVSSHRYNFEAVIGGMMNRITCEVSVALGLSCVDVAPILYPFANTNHSDGHHWFRSDKGIQVGDSILGDMYLSLILTSFCTSKR
eukprot:PhF_6_TR19652/c1_g2_i1/m.28677